VTRRSSGRCIAALCSVALATLAPIMPTTTLAAQATRTPANTARVVSLSAAVTEILYAIGAQGSLVAVAQGVHFPEAVQQLPHVGAARTLAAEPVLAHRPTLVLADSGVPAATVAQLRGAGVRVELFGGDASAQVVPRIRAVGTAVGRPAEAAALADRVSRELAALPRAVPTDAPRVLFVYARGAGTAFVAGEATTAHDLLQLAGLRNAIRGVQGFRPLTAEAVAASGAEVIVLPERGLSSVGGAAGLLNLPGIAQTPAGRQRRIVTLDDQLLLSFGPRTAQAALALRDAVRSRLAIAP
jgi:iron complex transport system substrate-binding protein